MGVDSSNLVAVEERLNRQNRIFFREVNSRMGNRGFVRLRTRFIRRDL